MPSEETAVTETTNAPATPAAAEAFDGVGLGDFLARGAPVAAPAKAVAEPGAADGGDPPKVDPPPASVAPAGEKPESGAAAEPPKGEATPAGEAKSEPAKVEAKPAGDDPWKARYESLQREHQRTREFAQRTDRELAEVKRAAKRAEAKADGTFDAAKEAAEDATASPAAVAAEAAMSAKVNASIAAAEKIYGVEYVRSMIFDPESPYASKYEKDPVANARIMSADAPVLEAIKFLKERELFEKYGDEPDKIIEKIRAEVLAESEKTIEAKVEERLKARLGVQERQVNGVAQGASSATGAAKPAAPAPTLGSILRSNCL